MAWNRPTSNTGNATSSSRPAGRGKMPRLRKGLIAGVIVVALGSAALWFFFSEPQTSTPKPRTAPSLIKSVKPAVAPTNTVETVQTNQIVPVAVLKTEKYPGERIIECHTNSSGIVLETTVDAQGRMTCHVIEPPPIWNHAADELLATVISTPPGREMPPLPDLSSLTDKEFLSACINPIKILPGDSEETKMLKMAVKEARKEIKERVLAGEHFRDILTEQHRLVNDNFEMRSTVSREYLKLVKEGDAEMASEYLRKANRVLEKMGLTPLRGDGHSHEPNQGKRRRNK